MGLRVPEEIEGPAEGVADEVGGKAAVEGAQGGGAFGCDQGVENADGREGGEGGAGARSGDSTGDGVD